VACRLWQQHNLHEMRLAVACCCCPARFGDYRCVFSGMVCQWVVMPQVPVGVAQDTVPDYAHNVHDSLPHSVIAQGS
jgi:hypothetical protein